ncbi:MAG: ABC transporter ATP-binding protein, partial [Clostridia bacterium]|nr:ABC transporter ATP-binding protein [Clostridia bacterium]
MNNHSNQRGNRGLGSKPEQKLDRKTTGHVIKRLSKYVLKQWPLFVLAIAMTLLSNQLSLLGPKYSGEAIDAIANENGVQFQLVWQNVVKMLVCYIFAAVLSYVLAVLMIKLTQRIVHTMRKQVFEKLTTLPVGFFDTHATGDIISRISYDIDTL